IRRLLCERLVPVEQMRWVRTNVHLITMTGRDRKITAGFDVIDGALHIPFHVGITLILPENTLQISDSLVGIALPRWIPLVGRERIRVIDPLLRLRQLPELLTIIGRNRRIFRKIQSMPVCRRTLTAANLRQIEPVEKIRRSMIRAYPRQRL